MSWTRRATTWFAALAGERADAPAAGEPPASLPPRAAAARPAAAQIKRQRGAFDDQAEGLETLRRQAHTDAVTGLPNRRQFVGRLSAALAEPGAPAATLLILRVLRLEELNTRLGYEATDRMLAAVADVLAAYPERVPGAYAGRLNGSDFALGLPVSGLGEETATTLLTALRASPAGTAAGAEMAIGGVEGLVGATASDALAAADEALAEAEAAGPYTIQVQAAASAAEAPLGERAWRQRIEQALADGRTDLGEFPLRDRAGGLLHLDCPLRVQLDPDGPYQAAGRWLAMASRGRLLPQVDLTALEVGLAAIAADGRARCIRVSSASLASTGFVGEVQRRLESLPYAADRLRVEVAEGALLERTLPRLREAGAAWRHHGVRLGLEYAGGPVHGLPRLAPVGLDHLKVGARFLRGVAAEDPARAFAEALVQLAHGLGWRVYADGIDDPRDLESLWALGFDGANGPAVTALEESIPLT